MKTQFLLLLIFFASRTFAQLEPEFGTHFYFEDAVGNRDTLFIGFDLRAKEEYNPEFGEDSLMVPFKEPFDVRAAQALYPLLPEIKGFLSKRIITGAERLYFVNQPWRDCNIGAKVYIFVKAVHFPVTMRWDPNEFALGTECVQASFLTTDRLVEILDPTEGWIRKPGKRFSCLSKADYFRFNLDPAFTKANFPSEYSYVYMRSYPDHPADTVYGFGLFHVDDPYFSPCKIWVASDDGENVGRSGFLFPNPAKDRLTFDFPNGEDVETLEILDGVGKRVAHFRQVETGSELNVSSFLPGIYFARYHAKNGLSATQRFMIQR